MARRSARIQEGRTSRLAASINSNDELHENADKKKSQKKVTKKASTARKPVIQASRPRSSAAAKASLETHKETSKGTKTKTPKRRKGPKSAKTGNKPSATGDGDGDATTTTTTTTPTTASTTTLPRTRELELLEENDNISFVIGIDEAGRGPLAGPVVAAAVLSTCATVPGICDSKKLTKEPARDELYRALTSSPNLVYAVAVVDARTIDETNILRATHRAMSMAASGVLGLATAAGRCEDSLSIRHEGCYVVKGATDERGDPIATTAPLAPLDPSSVVSLVDGNRMPPELPTEGDTMVRGDGREYLIGAASILAKVSRDALMHEYHQLYPHFMLDQHKGYPTAKHMMLLHEHGPLPIHRLTFAPLKHMDLGVRKGEDDKPAEKPKRRKKSSS